MTTQAPALPTWKDLYDQTEKFWTAPLQSLLGTETFVSLMGTTREQILTQQKTSREAFEAYWAAVRLPSLADHARLAGQVVALENKLEGLEDKLDDVTGKLGAIATQLEAVMPQLEALAAKKAKTQN